MEAGAKNKTNYVTDKSGDLFVVYVGMSMLVTTKRAVYHVR